MPVLRAGTSAGAATVQLGEAFREEPLQKERVDKFLRSGLMGRCANPACRSGWLQLFRRRATPIFEGGWTCSPECTEVRISRALRREFDGSITQHEAHRHRIPLGLLMLEQGWITRQQLRLALQAQKSCGSGRIGDWLIRQGGADESAVTRALGLQWGCPVLSPDAHFAGARSSVLPRIFLDAYGALPLRVGASRVLYLGFEECLDPVLAFAVERMSGLQVESGIVASSAFRPLIENVLKEQFPAIQLAEAVTVSAATHLLARAVERARPVASRLVRVHECVWLRMWQTHESDPIFDIGSISDVLCSIGSI